MTPFQPIDDIADARKQKKRRQAFYTPLSLVETIVANLRIAPGFVTVLEPSAGDGRIVHALVAEGYKVDACETDDVMHAKCEMEGARMVGRDFLAYRPDNLYDLIVMNPPFRRRQYIKHIEHAFSMLSTRGELTAIAPVSIKEDFKLRKVKLPDCDCLLVEDLPPDLFKESGASPATVLITATKSDGKPAECSGYSNWATFNVAVTISSDQELSLLAKKFTDGDCERYQEIEKHFRDALAKRNIFSYGANWQEIEDELREESDRMMDEAYAKFMDDREKAAAHSSESIKESLCDVREVATC